MSALRTDRIRKLTFDMTLPATLQDSLALADWVRDALLPVVEEALDQSRGAVGHRRIGRLELDLGTVSAAHSRSELPRRLLAALSDALESAAAEAPAAQDQAEEPGAALLAFLRTGQLARTGAVDAGDAHKRLLRQLLESAQAHQQLNAAVQEPHMLTRLVRQFDVQQLLELAAVLFAAWPQEERRAVLAWAADQSQAAREAGDDPESFWRWILTQSESAPKAAALQALWQAGEVSDASPATFTPAEMGAIGQGLANADFALLAPYWDRILSCAPQLLRNAAAATRQSWLRQFDDSAVADILCALQADCGWLIEQLVTVLPRQQLGALLRPAMRQWLAAPVDTLAPQVVLEWIDAAAPLQHERIEALFGARQVGNALNGTRAQLLEAARALFDACPRALRDTAMAAAGAQLQRLSENEAGAESFWNWVLQEYARASTPPSVLTPVQKAGLAGAGFAASEIAIIERSLETGQFALLAPYWTRLSSCAPSWLQQLNEDALTEIACAVQGPARETLLQEWLAAPVDARMPEQVLAQADTMMTDQSGSAPLSQGAAFILRTDGQMLAAAEVLVAAWAPARREEVLVWIREEARCSREAGVDGMAFWRWLLPALGEHGSLDALRKTWPSQAGIATARRGQTPDGVGRESPSLIEAREEGDQAALMASVRQLLQDWPQQAREDTLAWAREAVRGLREAGVESSTFWHWLLPALGQHGSLDALRRAWSLQADDAARDAPTSTGSLLRRALHDRTALAALIRQYDTPRLLAAARHLFRDGPRQAHEATLAWAQEEVARLQKGGADLARFWCWLLPALGEYASLDALRSAWSSQAGMAAPTAPVEPGEEVPEQRLRRALGDRAALTGLIRQYGTRRLLAAAGQLTADWPQQAREDTLAWAREEAGRLAQAGADSTPFWSWLLPALGKHASLDSLRSAWPSQAGRGEDVPEQRLRRALGDPAALTGLVRQYGTRRLLTAAGQLTADWPQRAREDTLAWAREEADRLETAGADSTPFWCWLLPALGANAGLDALRNTWSSHGGRPEDVLDRQLRFALDDRASLIGLIRQHDTRRLLTAARHLFRHWPQQARGETLAWADAELEQLHAAGESTESFWCWFLPRHAQVATLAALQVDYGAKRRRGHQENARIAPLESFAPEHAAAIEEGLTQARFDLLAPHWDRLREVAPAWICTRHRLHWRTWLEGFDDEVLLDLLAVVQADCKPMFERTAAIIPRERLSSTMRPSLEKWMSAAPQRLSPHVILMDVMKCAPQHAHALSALYYGDVPAGALAAVDSRHYREPLQVLGSLFSRADIIVISKALNAGQFDQLAPHWDRLLVLAPHWLRSEYPRLARTWLGGFDDEVLIDILSVVQADCCALIERLAGALSREELHAALRPSLPHWFALALDRLAPQSIMDDVLRAVPARAAQLRALVDDVAPGGACEVQEDWLDDALRRADINQLERHWPAVVLAKRGQLRHLWTQLSSEDRTRIIVKMTADLSLDRQVEIAVIVQPGVAIVMAELLRLPCGHAAHKSMLGCALRFLLHADTASVAPNSLVRHLLAQHHGLLAGQAPGAGRHVAALLPGLTEAPGEDDRAWEAALCSEAALRAYVIRCLDEDPQLGQLDSARLHRLLQIWTRMRQTEEGGGTFLPLIEARALQVDCPRAYFGKVLRQAVLGQMIDVDEIASACMAPLPAPPVTAANADGPSVPQRDRAPVVAPKHAALPEALRRALPRRLADAMLRADLSPLDEHWSAIVAHDHVVLAQAAQRYLGRADIRERFIGNTASGKMNDILGAISPAGASLIAPLLERAGQFGAMLATPLAPAAFQQRVLRYAFAQAMERQAAPDTWLSGLLHTILATSSQPAGPAAQNALAHAWYEALRANPAPSLAHELERSLFGSECLAVAMRRLQAGGTPEGETTLPITTLCERYPQLTDRLVEDGRLARAQAATFSAAEWHALARAQVPRQENALQQTFWREFSAHLTQQDEAGVQAAFASAFAVLQGPPRESVPADGDVPRPPQSGGRAPDADAIAILLMRERAPDAAGTASIGLLVQRLLADAGTAWHATLRSALRQEQAIERLTDSLSGPTLARLASILQPGLACQLPQVLRAIGDAGPIALPAIPAMLDRALWRGVYAVMFGGHAPASADALLHALAPGIGSVSLGASAAARVTPAQAMAQLLQPLTAPGPEKASARADVAPLPFTGDANLANAGLVLVAPYIERLFDLLGVTRDNDFVDDDARQRGVHLLQYVITAQESTPEHQLTLNKLMCAMPAAVPVVAGISMSGKEKDTIEQMLKGVIGHWSAIGSSSVAGLRETFLQREGCLYSQDEAWHLKVPQQTFDMLLDRLPWGYKLIKFPWMPAPLNVTWR